MDKNKNKNKNKNKINVLRSSRIIKIKSIGNTNYSLSTTYTSLRGLRGRTIPPPQIHNQKNQ